MTTFSLSLFVLFLSISFTIQQTETITVAKDGSGNFRTVADAVKSIKPATKQTTVKIMPGIYYERVNVSANLQQVIFLGTNKDKTIIIHDTAGSSVGTFASWTVIVEANDFIAEQVTFANNASNYEASKAGQSVALDLRGDKATIRNCNIWGAQDTLYTGKDRNYFNNCFINGSADSIFGEGASVFEDCTIEITSYITAHKGNEKTHTKYLLEKCNIRGPSNRAYTKEGTYLGRPWDCFAWVIYKDCTLGDLINPAGWWDWEKTADCLKTVNYDEAQNTGAGSGTASRVKWAHVLTAAEAAAYTPSTVLDGWTPPNYSFVNPSILTE